MIFIAQSIHGLPKAFMNKSVQLTIVGQPSQWLFFPQSGVVTDVVDHASVQHEKTAVNISAIADRFFYKLTNFAAVEIELPEPSGRLYRGDRRQSTMLAVKVEGRADVHIAHAIPV